MLCQASCPHPPHSSHQASNSGPPAKPSTPADGFLQSVGPLGVCTVPPHLLSSAPMATSRPRGTSIRGALARASVCELWGESVMGPPCAWRPCLLTGPAPGPHRPPRTRLPACARPGVRCWSTGPGRNKGLSVVL